MSPKPPFSIADLLITAVEQNREAINRGIQSGFGSVVVDFRHFQWVNLRIEQTITPSKVGEPMRATAPLTN